MTSFYRGLTVAVACSLFAGPAAPQSRATAPGKSRQLFVNVSTATGSPVLDLGPADFDVKEGGVKRTVVYAALATTPMRIALLVDTSDAAGPALTHMRSGLLAFLDALSPEQEVVLITLGEQLMSDYRQMSTEYAVDFVTDTTGPLAGVNVGVARSGIKMQLSYQRRFP